VSGCWELKRKFRIKPKKLVYGKGENMKLLLRSAVVITLILLAGTCFADQITIQSVTPSSTFFTYDVNNLINGSGLVGNLHDNDWEHMWITDGTPTGWLIFDLGAVYSLGYASVWNYNAICCGLDRSVLDMDVLLSNDGVNYTLFGSFVLTEGTGGWIPPDTLALTGASARYIKFNLNSDYGDPDYIGLSEVQFYGATTPEPASMVLLGSGVLALARKLRKRA
jgi:hypothetical protein